MNCVQLPEWSQIEQNMVTGHRTTCSLVARVANSCNLATNTTLISEYMVYLSDIGASFSMPVTSFVSQHLPGNEGLTKLHNHYLVSQITSPFYCATQETTSTNHGAVIMM